MAKRDQSTYYPPQAKQSNFNPQGSGMCLKCHSASPYSLGGSSHCGMTTPSCGTYCDGTGSQNVCSSRQAYCSIGRQRITSHADINAHPAIACVAKDEIIAKNWTAAYWNALIDELATAEDLGHANNMPNTPNVYVQPTQVITADIYNAMVTKYNNFSGGLSQVQKDQVIYGANHAATLTNKYGQLVFNTSVCDICNASAQGGGKCTCACGGCTCGSCSGCNCSCSSD